MWSMVGCQMTSGNLLSCPLGGELLLLLLLLHLTKNVIDQTDRMSRPGV